MTVNLVMKEINAKRVNIIICLTAYCVHIVSDVNECSSEPCMNEGTCNDLVDGYTCDCPAGYEGIDCEKGTEMLFVL